MCSIQSSRRREWRTWKGYPVFGAIIDEYILELKENMSPQIQKAHHNQAKISQNEFVSRYITKKVKHTEGKEILKTVRDKTVLITEQSYFLEAGGHYHTGSKLLNSNSGSQKIIT